MNPSSLTSSGHAETSSTSSESEQKTRTESDYTDQTKNTPRSRESHRGITIRGGGPASGRPRRTPTASDCPAAVADGSAAVFMIVRGWSGC
ncbi:hypothetical protein C8E95_4877 [Pseudonocardia autotrophica]|jgi:hypothetical protein|uniref:Uncharacterized protein n=2 Tax=Pseudonocardia TaxID=1847 RepID=A0A1Y2MKA2_PSEAH|nr:hypothetical protein BG845_05904 [Pseudonocardia autotrophica]TDN75697.1 hypothetical protein C8E95_4877 [Pseudonocardia autotrophica]